MIFLQTILVETLMSFSLAGDEIAAYPDVAREDVVCASDVVQDNRIRRTVVSRLRSTLRQKRLRLRIKSEESFFRLTTYFPLSFLKLGADP
jgi:hypothetical protein